MSRLIASILLSVLLFPLAAVLYLIVFFVCIEGLRFRGSDEFIGMIVAGVITSAFIAWYWITAWRKTVKWTPLRIARTGYAAAGSVVVGVVLGALTDQLDHGFGYFIGTVVPPLLWVAATVLVWRETDAERAARLRAQGRGDRPAIPCPTCGYDMTGLKSTRCPECGSEFTVDELLAALPGRAAVELER